MQYENNLTEFNWDSLGNISEGRKNLGLDVPVHIYRLFAYALKDTLCRKYGVEAANSLFRKAGYLAGSELAKNVLDLSGDFDYFIANLANKLKELKIGYLRIEKANLDSMSFILTVSEDLECSGLPITNETICDYDEGFFEGILEVYSGYKFDVEEIDCWATGGRLCRFIATLK